MTALPASRRARIGSSAQRTTFRTFLWAAWLPIALLVLWWFGSSGSTSAYFPPLQTILQRAQEVWIWDGLRTQLLPSLANLAGGYLLAAVLGILLATVLVRSPRLTRAVNPIVYFLYVLPPPALLPAVILIFGIGPFGKVFIIFYTAFWPVLLNSLDGMRGAEPIRLDVARVTQMTRRMTTWRVIVPGALPQIFAGLRVGLQFGIILMVVSEFAAATQGIGYFILFSQQTFRIADMWTGMIVLGIIGSLLNFLFFIIERQVLTWHYQSRASLDAL